MAISESQPAVKTRKLALALEFLALIISALLILVDYRLKRDLLDLFKRLEFTIERGQRLYYQDAAKPRDNSGVPASSMVGDNPIMEETTNPEPSSSNGQATAPIRSTTAKRTARARDTDIPESNKPLGT